MDGLRPPAVRRGPRHNRLLRRAGLEGLVLITGLFTTWRTGDRGEAGSFNTVEAVSDFDGRAIGSVMSATGARQQSGWEQERGGACRMSHVACCMQHNGRRDSSRLESTHSWRRR